MSSSEDDIPLAARSKKPAPLNDNDADIPLKQRATTEKTLSRRVDGLVDREVDAAGTPKPNPKSVVNKAEYSEPASKKKRIVVSDDESDDDAPLARHPAVNGSNGHAKRKSPPSPASSSDDDAPLGQKLNKAKGQVSKKPKISRARSDSDDDLPLAAKSKAKPKPFPQVKKSSSPIVKKKPVKQESDSDDDVPLARAKPTAKPAKRVKPESDSDDDIPLVAKSKKVKKEPKSTPKPNGIKKESTATPTTKKANGKRGKSEDADTKEEDDDEYRWWEAAAGQSDGTKKWTTLEHNGVLFPPPYEPLPKHVKMKYDGQEVTLPPEAEEVAGFFAALIESDHGQNPVFQQNFFNDWLTILKEQKAAPQIKKFEKCDFRPMWEYFETKKEEKKKLTKEEKLRIKKEKDELEAQYKTCLLDGRKENVGNFRIEPPGLFRGRGKHPKTGKLKTRVQPEQITINIGADAKVPIPPTGHKWAEIRHDNTVTWLATWNENINGATKYVFLAAGSSLKGQSDLAKYEKARKLKGHIDTIRRNYTRDLKDEFTETRQRATAMYLIDRFALRAGNEKGEDEADTVGCCSLRYEHITLEPPNKVTFDFLGKDSIRYLNTVEVDPQVFKNLKIFKRPPKQEGDMLFDRINTGSLNKHLGELMPGLSAKVFRTFNASYTFQDQLRKLTPRDCSIVDKFAAYTEANRQVAILCNHKRAVPKTHDVAIGKIEDQVRGLKYQKMRLRKQMLQLDSKLKKKHPELLEYESDIDDEWIRQHQKDLVEKQRESIRKKFEKENEKRAKENEKPLGKDELQRRLEVAEEAAKEFARENKTGVVEPTGSQTVEKCKKALEKLDEKIYTLRSQREMRDLNKETALGTSKLNYIDPRLSFAWSKQYGVPIEKLFAKTLREKFKWASTVEEDWEF